MINLLDLWQFGTCLSKDFNHAEKEKIVKNVEEKNYVSW